MILVLPMFRFKRALSLFSSTLIERLCGPLCFLPLEWYHPHIWGCWCFSLLLWFQFVTHPANNLMRCSACWLNKQGDSRQPCRAPYSILDQSVVPYRVLTAAAWTAYRFLRRQERCCGLWHSHIFKRFPQFGMIHRVRGFSVLMKQRSMFFWNSLDSSMNQWMFAVWSLVPLPFPSPGWISGSSWFT